MNESEFTYILNGAVERCQDDPVGGVMLVTPDFVMFDPDEGSASNSALQRSATVAMNAVLSVAVYHDDQLRYSTTVRLA